MNSPILRRTRLWTLAAAVAISLAMSSRVETRFLLGFLGSAVWAALGFWAVELLVRHALVPPGHPRNGRAVGLLVLGKAALYGVALWVLLADMVPAMSCILGFSLLLVVLVVAALVGKPTLQIRPPAE